MKTKAHHLQTTAFNHTPLTFVLYNNTSKIGLRVTAVLLLLFIYLHLSFNRNVTMMAFAGVDLSNCTQSIFIPYIHEFNSKDTPPMVQTTIQGVQLQMPVDTGSTGLLIGAPILPDIDPNLGIPAHHFLTSSKILYVGRLVELPIKFHGVEETYAIAKVPVLVVDKSFLCHWYDPTKDTFECPLGPHGEKPTPRNTSRITYMGVGFGRNRPGDGQPTANPGRNPFLNLQVISGETVGSQKIRAGYTISTHGVHLGLTETNTRGFNFIHLEPGLTHNQDSRDWAMAKMCFRIDNIIESCGPGLVDTGIAHMYIRTEEGVSIPNITIPNPNPNGFAKWVIRAKPGTNITIDFPTFGEGRVAGYSFTVGKESSMEPNYVVPVKQAPLSFVNTGRNFLFGYSIAFDAVGGRFGFRPTRSTSL